jgi:endogenous inhibitor of DNA gyrase (YacG/DUF329 family)
MARAKPVTTSAAASPGKCPICGRATVTDYRPFCSRRCADVDLSRWLSGAYAIPARPDDDEDGESIEGAETSKKDESGPRH